MDYKSNKFLSNYCPPYRDLSLYEEMSNIKKIEKTETKIKRTILVSLFSGDDLIPIIKRICLEEAIRGAFVSAIGAADRIPIAAFNLSTGKYDEIIKTGYHEVMSVNGNVSTILDDNNNAIDLLIHLHIAFADNKGNAYGGHLLPGFSAAAVGEVCIREVEGGMYRYQSEIEKNGYSTIKFNVPVSMDSIPVCRDSKNTENYRNEILTKSDAIKIVQSGLKKIILNKISNITSEAYEHLRINEIDIEIK